MKSDYSYFLWKLMRVTQRALEVIPSSQRSEFLHEFIMRLAEVRQEMIGGERDGVQKV